MTDRRPAECWLTDMDGVLVHEGVPVPGAQEFIQALEKSGKRYLVLTNNSIYTPRDLHARLRTSGIDVPPSAIWTSALATAQFLDSQRPEGTAYTIGEAGLTTALHEIGYTLTDSDPDYVVLGETRSYSFTAITRAIRLVDGGARFIRDEPGPDRPVDRGRAAGDRRGRRADHPGHRRRSVLRGQAQPADDALGAEQRRRAQRDDRDDRRPDGHRHRRRHGGGLETVLVLSGMTSRGMIDRFPYRPSRVVDSIADLVDEIH
jgi:NagD protein